MEMSSLYSQILASPPIALENLIAQLQLTHPALRDTQHNLFLQFLVIDTNTGALTLQQFQDSLSQLLVAETSGGAFHKLYFNTFEYPQYKHFNDGSKKVPKWRQVGKGLNMEGLCTSLDCEVKGRKVWDHKGYRLFNMNSETTKCKCPLCKKPLSQVCNIGIYMAHVTISGLIESGEEVSKIFTHSDPASMRTFNDNPYVKDNWEYLEINVQRLDPKSGQSVKD